MEGCKVLPFYCYFSAPLLTENSHHFFMVFALLKFSKFYILKAHSRELLAPKQYLLHARASRRNTYSMPDLYIFFKSSQFNTSRQFPNFYQTSFKRKFHRQKIFNEIFFFGIRYAVCLQLVDTQLPHSNHKTP